jgi:hypothetical protein
MAIPTNPSDLLPVRSSYGFELLLYGDEKWIRNQHFFPAIRFVLYNHTSKL